MTSHNNKFTRGDGLLEGFLAKKRAEKANDLIPLSARNGKILDIGCGTTPFFLMSCVFKDKYGIDPNLAKNSFEKGLTLKKIKLSDKKLPFENNFFDVVSMLAVFEHIENEYLQNILSEVLRILKKNGVFIITTPSPWSDKILHSTARLGLISKVEIHDHKHNHPKTRIEDILVRAGFKRDNIESGYFELGFNMWFKATK